MSDETVITASDINKAYRIWTHPFQRLTSPLLAQSAKLAPFSAWRQRLARRSTRAYRDFYALRGISFTIKRGEAFGIIGRNGSGKSTLLQIMAGTLQPTDGQISVQGRVAALLELGSGFNPEFTGRENVFLTGAVMGFDRRTMSSLFERVTDFADIGDFIDQPVKTYSSGMMVRLAFAVQTIVEPDILIIDEALSVGDFFFAQKCARRMSELRELGTTLIFVSHDMASVRDLTSRALLLDQGRPLFLGDTKEAVARYYQLDQKPRASSPTPAEAGAQPSAGPDSIPALENYAMWRESKTDASSPVIIEGVGLLDANNYPLFKVQLGQKAVVSMSVLARQACTFHAALEIKNRYDQIACSLSTSGCGLPPVELAAGSRTRIDFTITFNLEGGLYSMCAILSQPDERPNRGARLISTGWFGPLVIQWNYESERAPFLGLFGPPFYVQVHAN